MFVKESFVETRSTMDQVAFAMPSLPYRNSLTVHTNVVKITTLLI